MLVSVAAPAILRCRRSDLGPGGGPRGAGCGVANERQRRSAGSSIEGIAFL